MDGYQKRSLKKRRDILAASEQLFLREGIRGSTMKDIAKEASVSPVTIYNYFGSKERVVYEVVKKLLEDYTRRFEDIVYDSSLTFKDKTKALLRYEVELVDSLSEDLLQSFYNPKDKALKKLVSWYTENRLLIGFQHMVREGRKEGEVSTAVEEESIMVYLGMFKSLASEDIRHDKSRLKDLLHIFFYGIGGKHGH